MLQVIDDEVFMKLAILSESSQEIGGNTASKELLTIIQYLAKID